MFITHLGALAILRELVGQSAATGLWYTLKVGCEVVLSTGAKLCRDENGNFFVFGYAWDKSDVNPYEQYKLGKRRK